jgi:hypothetical protein
MEAPMRDCLDFDEAILSWDEAVEMIRKHLNASIGRSEAVLRKAYASDEVRIDTGFGIFADQFDKMDHDERVLHLDAVSFRAGMILQIG